MIISTKRNRYRFTERKHSPKGIAVSLLSLLPIGAFVLFVMMAFHSSGRLSVYFGCFGVIAMLASIALLVFAVQSLFEENSFKLFPRLAVVLSLAACLCWIGAYLIGMGIL